MRAAFDIALKDLRQRMRDRSALLIGIVAPFVLAVLFSVMLGGIDEDFHAEWGVVDLDGGEIAAALLDGPVAGIAEAGVISVTDFADRAAASAAVDAGTIQTAVVIPAGFSAAAASGGGGEVDHVDRLGAGLLHCGRGGDRVLREDGGPRAASDHDLSVLEVYLRYELHMSPPRDGSKY